jgi:DNA-binding CsgD family transcriptional regulator
MMLKQDISSVESIVNRRGLPGLLLFDTRAKLVSCNSIASQILRQSRQRQLLQKIRSSLKSLKRPHSSHKSAIGSPAGPLIQESFSSGRRHYSLQAFFLDQQPGEHAGLVAILLERINPSRFDLRKNKHHFSLSPREVEVIQALKGGMSDKEIAFALGISYETVRGYLKAIRAKLEVSNRTAILTKLLSL